MRLSGDAGRDAVEAIPELLGGETLDRETPEGMQNGVPVPVGRLGLRPGLADAVDGGQPEGVGQAEIDAAGGPGQPSGAVLDQGSYALGGSQIGLLDDAGLALDARRSVAQDRCGSTA